MKSLDQLKPELQRTLALAVPAAVLLFGAFLVAPPALEIGRTRRQADACQQAAVLRKRENLIELAAEGRQRLSASPQTRDEPLVFLRTLNQMVALSGVRLVSYKPPAAATSARGGSAPAAAKSAVIQPIACEVTVSGVFADQVRLFRKLATSQRLFTVNNLQVRVDAYPKLASTFRIVRYVTPVSVAIAHAEGASLVRTASGLDAETLPLRRGFE
jgi:hypothetical protein